MSICKGDPTNCNIIYSIVGLLLFFIILTILWLARKYKSSKEKLAKLDQEYQELQAENQRLKNETGQWNG